jgi:hypothetical protein
MLKTFFFILLLGIEEKSTMYEGYLNDYAFTISDPMNASGASGFNSRRRGVLAVGDGGTCIL